MSYPNSALSAWQLAIMAVAAVTALAGWLAAVFLAAREPRADRAAVSSPAGMAGTGTARISQFGAEHEPARQGGDREAA
jgi:hypothetical protein